MNVTMNQKQRDVEKKEKEQGGGGRNGTMEEGGVKMEGSFEGAK